MRMKFRLLGLTLAGAVLVQTSGCGSLFFPDRRGQIDGDLDPLVVGLDAVGLFFYVIPGLIAYAIDFTTGAIYLPNAQYSVAPEVLKGALDASGQVDRSKLRAVLLQSTGQDVPLDDPRLQEFRGSAQQLVSLGLIPRA